ncbi:MAG: extracellular solute-binding protein [Halioglobus sp.]
MSCFGLRGSRPALLLTGLLTLGLVACGGNDGDSNAKGANASSDGFAPHDNRAEVQAYYEADPEFFSFKTIADLPADLNWENGSELPEMGSPKAKKGGTQYLALQDFPRTLRTIGPDSNGSFRAWILDDLEIRTAMRHQDEFEFVPGIANEWAIADDNRTVYVRIDPQARFSDGEAITTDDYFFSFWFWRSPYITAPWYNNFFSTSYTNISRYDDHTFSITTVAAKPDTDARVLELMPLPEHFFREVGEDFVERYQWRSKPTTGAYIVRQEDIKKGRSIAMSRIDNWWAKDKKHYRYRFNPDRLQFTVIRDTEKIFEAFRRGDIDQYTLNLAEYWYEKLPDSAPDVQAGYIQKSIFYNQRPRSNFGLWINTARPLLDDLDIRLGINYATNWQLVIDKYFRGDYSRLNSAQHGFGEFSHPTLTSREYDIDKALEHFAKAGFTQRGPDGILVNETGERLSFTLSTGYLTMKDILTILKEEAAKAGVEFRIELLDGTASWKKVQEKQHDIHFAAFGVFLEMLPRFWEHYSSENAYENAFLEDGSINPERKIKVQTNNLESYANPEMDPMIVRFRESDDKEEMIALSHKMQELHFDNASFVPGFYSGFYRIASWRWIRYPEFFNHKHSSNAGQLFVHWIDTEMKEETLEARKSGKAFEPEINIYDQWLEKAD